MDLDLARNRVVLTVKKVGFTVTSVEQIDSHDFEVWVEYEKDGQKGQEALYFEMKIEDGRVNLYWCDFTHTTLVCRLDRTRNGIRLGLQKLYRGELNPKVPA